MPIYEYECKACGQRLEKLQKMSDDPLRDCPACNKPELLKLVSGGQFRLKGSGWYETDFKTGKKKNVAGDSGSSSESGGSGSSNNNSSSGSESGGSGSSNNNSSSGSSAAAS